MEWYIKLYFQKAALHFLRAGGVVEVVELRRCQDLSSNPSTAKKIK
jgi:hypothetical protein